MARVAALGDAHLGRSAYPYTTADGLYVRERDFEVSFERAVDAALAQDPDVLVWLGDIFDFPRPTYHTFRVVQRALARIRDQGVATVVISGNHDTPRLPGTGSPYTVLADTFPDVHFATRVQYERIELPGLVVHAVPQMLTVEATLAALDEADRSRSLDCTNLLLTHPRVPQVEPKYADINEIEVDAAMLRSDLVLLGHYHSHRRVMDGIWYAGATDTFSFADEPDAKGIVVLDTDSGECKHVAVDGRRPLVSLESLYALDLSPEEIQARLADAVSELPEGAVARIYIDGVDPEAWRLVDFHALRDAWHHALHVEYKPVYAGAHQFAELPELDSIGAQWHRYLDVQDLNGYDRDRIRRLGDQYLSRAVEEAS